MVYIDDTDNPFLLAKGHYFTDLIVMESHNVVGHNGVRGSYFESYSRYLLDTEITKLHSKNHQWFSDLQTARRQILWLSFKNTTSMPVFLLHHHLLIWVSII